MTYDKQAVEAAEKYAKSICELAGVDNDSDLPMRKDFLAGVKWERERIRKRLLVASDIVKHLEFPQTGDCKKSYIGELRKILDELLGEN